MGRVEGKVGFITGAARGQGRAHAVRLAQEGADIIGIDVCERVGTTIYPPSTPEDLEETVRLVEKQGQKMLARQADVRDYPAVKAAVDDGVAEFGRLDIVAASAGIVTYGLTEELEEHVWQDMVDVNLTGVWHTCKAAIPHLIAGARGGSIIITTSIAGLKGVPLCAHYTAAKHGAVGLMKTMVNELGQHSIRVNTLHPTNVNTDMFHNDETYRLFLPDSPNPNREDATAAAYGMHVLPIPWVEPEDLANALLFLASDEARFITGATLPIDAGVLQKF
jgi:(+)-trans-carveol dehydrogenase